MSIAVFPLKVKTSCVNLARRLISFTRKRAAVYTHVNWMRKITVYLKKIKMSLKGQEETFYLKI